MDADEDTDDALVLHALRLEDTDRIGGVLARVLPDGTTVALVGTLGAGKTRLVQAIAAAAGVPRQDVTSPTFVLCQHYQAARTFHHLDAYRIGDEDEFLELGPDEYFESPAITLVEWADRVQDCLPRQYIEIRIDVTGHTQRQFTIKPFGSRYRAVIAQLTSQLQSNA